jgi:hypothetical protein
VAFDVWLADHEEIVVKSVRDAVPPFALSACELSICIGRTCIALETSVQELSQNAGVFPVVLFAIAGYFQILLCSSGNCICAADLNRALF